MDRPASTVDTQDVAIVGGGPAGLTAAVYLGRFHRSVTVLDAGDARAEKIPLSHNIPGFPEGISGSELLARLRMQATKYGASILNARVASIKRRSGDYFVSPDEGLSVSARKVILATGLVDLAPDIEGLGRAVQKGLVRLCPLCDAYEVTGKAIGVAGPNEKALSEAIFLRSYSDRVAILSNDAVSPAVRRQARSAGVHVWDAVEDLVPASNRLDVITAGGETRRIDALYPAMGCEVRSELGALLGATCDDNGCIVVDGHLRTSVDGLYAIGDVTQALNQIAVAFGQAAIAATDIHNSLREKPDCA